MTQFRLTNPEEHQNFIQQNIVKLIKAALEGLANRGKGCLVVDCESRSLKKQTKKYTTYNLNLRYSVSEDAYLPEVLKNAVARYNPKMHFILAFQNTNYLRYYFIGLPKEEYLPKIDLSDNIFKPVRPAVLPEESTIKFLSNNYYFLAALSYKANKFQTGIIVCNIGLSKLTLSQYLQSKIISQIDFEKLAISFDSEIMTNPEIKTVEKTYKQFNHDRNLIVGFRQGIDFQAKIVDCKTRLPKDCYRTLSPQLRSTIDNYLR